MTIQEYGILVNIFSIRFSSLKHILSLIFHQKKRFIEFFIHIRHFDFEMWGKNLYTLRMKNPRMSNHHPPFFFSTHTTIIVPLSPPKVSFGFLAVVSIYQLVSCMSC